jgi:hypothetical protein
MNKTQVVIVSLISSGIVFKSIFHNGQFLAESNSRNILLLQQLESIAANLAAIHGVELIEIEQPEFNMWTWIKICDDLKDAGKIVLTDRVSLLN